MHSKKISFKKKICKKFEFGHQKKYKHHKKEINDFIYKNEIIKNKLSVNLPSVFDRANGWT